MARTPLFHALVRALHLSRGAERAGIPRAEFAEQERARRAVSRRRFLEISAAAASIPALAACGDETRPAPAGAPTVAIVGGGIAGLHCAYRLKKLGVVATVYDAADRVGGRMFTDRQTFPEGMFAELGGEFIDTDHATMHALATELGLDLYDFQTDDTNLSDHVLLVGGKMLTVDEVFNDFEPIAAKILAAVKTLHDPTSRRVTYDNPNGAEALDGQSVTAWLDGIGATGPVRALLDIIYALEFGLESDVSSALNLLLTIDTNASKLALGGDSDERFHTKLGNDSFPTRLAAKLDPAQIQLGMALAAISEGADGRYLLTFEQGSSTKEITADHVVMALPFSVLRSLDVKLDFPAVKKTAIATIGYGTNAKLISGYSSRLWRTKLGSTGDTLTDLPYQTTWETSRLQPGTGGVLTNFTGGKRGVALGDGTPKERLADLLPELEQLLPGITATSTGTVTRMHWPSNPLTLGSYSGYLVGQYTGFAGAEIERYKNVHFCGEHTALEVQGYMEGGALTGAMAAQEVATDLGLGASTTKKRHLPHEIVDPGARIVARAQASWEARRRHSAARRAR